MLNTDYITYDSAILITRAFQQHFWNIVNVTVTMAHDLPFSQERDFFVMIHNTQAQACKDDQVHGWQPNCSAQVNVYARAEHVLAAQKQISLQAQFAARRTEWLEHELRDLM